MSHFILTPRWLARKKLFYCLSGMFAAILKCFRFDSIAFHFLHLRIMSSGRQLLSLRDHNRFEFFLKQQSPSFVIKVFLDWILFWIQQVPKLGFIKIFRTLHCKIKLKIKFLLMKTWKNGPKKLLRVHNYFFFCTGLAALRAHFW